MSIRELDIATLDNAGKECAAWFISDQLPHDRNFVRDRLYRFNFKDEFEHVVAAARPHLGPVALAEFDAMVAQLPPRSDEAFLALLEEKRPAGYVPIAGQAGEGEG